jgi:hypothetical protein
VLSFSTLSFGRYTAFVKPIKKLIWQMILGVDFCGVWGIGREIKD